MKEIKRRLLSLAMTGLLLLGTTLSEAHAGEDKSLKNVDEATKNAAAERLMKSAGKQSDSKKSKSTDSEAQAEKSKSKTEKSDSDKAEKTKDDSEKSDKTEKSKDKSEKNEQSEKSKDKTDKGNEDVRLTLSISKPSGLDASDGVCQIDPEAVSTLTLSWKCKGDCDSFEVSVSGGIYSASTGKKSAKIPVGDLPEGQYTATVKAIRDGKTVAREKLSFKIVRAEAKEDPQSSKQEAAAENAVDEAAQAQEPSEQEQQASTEEQPAGEQDESTEEQPVEEQQVPTEEQSVEDVQELLEEQPVEDVRETAEEQPAEDVRETAEEQPAGDVQETAEEQPAGDVQTTSEEQPAEEVPVTTEEQPVELIQETVEEQRSEDARNATEEQPADAVQEILLDEIVLAETADPAEAAKPAQKSEPVVDVQADGDEATVEAATKQPEDLIILDESLEELTSEADQSVDAEIENAISDAVDANAPMDEEKSDAAITLSVTGAQGISVIGSAIHIDPAQAGTVAIVWQYDGKCDEYAVSVSGGVYDTTTSKTRLSLPIADLPAGQYAVTVAAMKDGEKTSSAQLSFRIDEPGSAEGSESDLSLTVASPQGLLITEGVYQVDPTQADVLTLAWYYGGECDGYDVTVSGDVYSGRVEAGNLTLPLTGMDAGSYTVSVAAIKDESPVAEAQLVFAIAGEEKKQDEQQGEDQKQAQQPKGGGAKGGGSSKGGGARGGGTDEVEQGFHITPGEALVSTHNSGSRDMSLYGAIDLTLDANTAMTQLILGGVALDVRLSDGEPFTASIEANALTLVPVGESKVWLLNGYALKTLSRSGISTLRLALGDETVDFPTQPKLTGSNYGILCAAGVASKDFCFAVDGDGCSVTVAERTYQLTGEGELV